MALFGKELVRTLTYVSPELRAALKAAKSLNCRGPAFQSRASLPQERLKGGVHHYLRLGALSPQSTINVFPPSTRKQLFVVVYERGRSESAIHRPFGDGYFPIAGSCKQEVKEEG